MNFRRSDKIGINAAGVITAKPLPPAGSLATGLRITTADDASSVSFVDRGTATMDNNGIFIHCSGTVVTLPAAGFADFAVGVNKAGTFRGLHITIGTPGTDGFSLLEGCAFQTGTDGTVRRYFALGSTIKANQTLSISLYFNFDTLTGYSSINGITKTDFYTTGNTRVPVFVPTGSDRASFGLNKTEAGVLTFELVQLWGVASADPTLEAEDFSDPVFAEKFLPSTSIVVPDTPLVPSFAVYDLFVNSVTGQRLLQSGGVGWTFEEEFDCKQTVLERDQLKSYAALGENAAETEEFLVTGTATSSPSFDPEVDKTFLQGWVYVPSYDGTNKEYPLSLGKRGYDREETAGNIFGHATSLRITAQGGELYIRSTGLTGGTELLVAAPSFFPNLDGWNLVTAELTKGTSRLMLNDDDTIYEITGTFTAESAETQSLSCTFSKNARYGPQFVVPSAFYGDYPVDFNDISSIHKSAYDAANFQIIDPGKAGENIFGAPAKYAFNPTYGLGGYCGTEPRRFGICGPSQNLLGIREEAEPFKIPELIVPEENPIAFTVTMPSTSLATDITGAEELVPGGDYMFFSFNLIMDSFPDGELEFHVGYNTSGNLYRAAVFVVRGDGYCDLYAYKSDNGTAVQYNVTNMHLVPGKPMYFGLFYNFTTNTGYHQVNGVIGTYLSTQDKVFTVTHVPPAVNKPSVSIFNKGNTLPVVLSVSNVLVCSLPGTIAGGINLASPESGKLFVEDASGDCKHLPLPEAVLRIKGNLLNEYNGEVLAPSNNTDFVFSEGLTIDKNCYRDPLLSSVQCKNEVSNLGGRDEGYSSDSALFNSDKYVYEIFWIYLENITSGRLCSAFGRNGEKAAPTQTVSGGFTFQQRSSSTFGGAVNIGRAPTDGRRYVLASDMENDFVTGWNLVTMKMGYDKANSFVKVNDNPSRSPLGSAANSSTTGDASWATTRNSRFGFGIQIMKRDMDKFPAITDPDDIDAIHNLFHENGIMKDPGKYGEKILGAPARAVCNPAFGLGARAAVSPYYIGTLPKVRNTATGQAITSFTESEPIAFALSTPPGGVELAKGTKMITSTIIGNTLVADNTVSLQDYNYVFVNLCFSLDVLPTGNNIRIYSGIRTGGRFKGICIDIGTTFFTVFAMNSDASTKVAKQLTELCKITAGRAINISSYWDYVTNTNIYNSINSSIHVFDDIAVEFTPGELPGTEDGVIAFHIYNNNVAQPVTISVNNIWIAGSNDPSAEGEDWSVKTFGDKFINFDNGTTQTPQTSATALFHLTEALRNDVNGQVLTPTDTTNFNFSESVDVLNNIIANPLRTAYKFGTGNSRWSLTPNFAKYGSEDTDVPSNWAVGDRWTHVIWIKGGRFWGNPIGFYLNDALKSDPTRFVLSGFSVINDSPQPDRRLTTIPRYGTDGQISDDTFTSPGTASVWNLVTVQLERTSSTGLSFKQIFNGGTEISRGNSFVSTTATIRQITEGYGNFYGFYVQIPHYKEYLYPTIDFSNLQAVHDLFHTGGVMNDPGRYGEKILGAPAYYVYNPAYGILGRSRPDRLYREIFRSSTATETLFETEDISFTI